MGEVTYSGGRKNINLLEGSQASLVLPTDKGSMKMKTLEWLEVVALDRGPRILIF
jgi:hypothetical protein